MFFLSLSLIFIVGGVLGYLAKKVNLPSLIVYLLLGIFLCYFKLIDESILNISSELRKIALIIILLKGGFSLDLKALKKAGKTAILLSFIPAVTEMIVIGIVGPIFFDLTYLQSFILGSVIGAVSPAVVVPRMIKMIENNQGAKKGIPQMIIAASSIDDIIMIVCFTSLLTLQSGNSLNVMTFINVPLSIVLGVLIGVLTGIVLSMLFKKIHIRDSIKLLIIFGICFGYVYIETLLTNIIGFSSLLACITIGMTILFKSDVLSSRLAKKCDSLWSLFEILLFVLVGASISINSIGTYLVPALLVIIIGLIFRMIATYLCTSKSGLSFKEKVFVSISYIPKATIQATIGSGLLDLGNSLGSASIISAGTIVLAASVISILFTAPVGAIGIDLSVKKLIND